MLIFNLAQRSLTLTFRCTTPSILSHKKYLEASTTVYVWSSSHLLLSHLLCLPSYHLVFLSSIEIKTLYFISSLRNLRIPDDYNMHSDNTGWSTTRGITNLDKDDFQDEFGQHSHVMNVDHPTLTDLVRKQPCDKESPNMQELTSSWLNDPNAKDVNNRLNSLDKETWASSAK